MEGIMRSFDTYRGYLRNVNHPDDWRSPLFSPGQRRLEHPELIAIRSERGELHYISEKKVLNGNKYAATSNFYKSISKRSQTK